MRGEELIRKNLSIHLRTYERLKVYGQIGTSFSDAIDNIIDYAESKGLTPASLMEFNKHTKHK